jgi:hypothetical protein
MVFIRQDCSIYYPLPYFRISVYTSVYKILNYFFFIGMPGVVGAIDGTHIAIPGPTQHQENYINRKGFHSIVAQVVCDHEMRFISVSAGWPGSD